MKIDIKKILLEEGILQGVKDNWGKTLIAAGGIAAANAGAFGDKAQDMVQSGGSKLSEFTKAAGDWSQDSMDKMNNTYGVDSNGDGIKTMAENGQDKIEQVSADAIDKKEEMSQNINDNREIPNAIDHPGGVQEEPSIWNRMFGDKE